MAASNNFWEPWTTSAFDDMKSNGGRQFGIPAFVKRKVAHDNRLDNTRVELSMTVDKLRDFVDGTAFSMKMHERLKDEVRSQTPSCAECGNVKCETQRSINALDLQETVVATARCTQSVGPFPSMGCPKRAMFYADKPAAAWPSEPEMHEPEVEQSPDVPQNYGDAW